MQVANGMSDRPVSDCSVSVMVGVSTVLFGLLDKLENGKVFLAFSFVLRIIAAAGNAAFLDPVRLSETIKVQSISDLQTKYYLRLEAKDEPGVLAQIGSALAENNISISSFIQKGFDPKHGTAELVIMTHRATERSVQIAVKDIMDLGVVAGIGNMIRVAE
mgnify:CR=1 FL=1